MPDVGMSVDATVAALEADGRLTPESAGLVGLARNLAESCAADPGNAALWRELRQTLQALMALEPKGSDDHVVFLTRVSTPMGDRPQP